MTARTESLDSAASRVRAVDNLAVPLGPGQPSAFMHALAERDDWENLQIFGALLVDLYPIFLKPGVHHLSGFFGPAERLLREMGADIQFIPSDFRRFAPIVADLAPRVMATLAAPPDRDGYVSLSLHAGATVDELHRCGADPERVLVVEINDACPRTLGLPPDWPHRLHLDEIDVLVESERPVFTMDDAEPTDVERKIAERAAAFASDGCTLQTGIGGIPSQVVKILAAGSGGDYGVHSEMFTTGLMHLHQAGKVSNRSKGTFDGYSITTFAAGTAELYEWLDGNELVRFLPVDVVNSPENISANHEMISINGALTIDLWGQAVADTISGRQFSGIGGHEDFVAASGLELEDRSLLCLPSTSTVDGELVSRIVSVLPAGAVVTTPRHQLDVVVTEHGVAELRGRTVRERAAALADVAHPDFRDDLHAHAETLS
ncbi:MAG: 4-hydroxybutyrate CoA-transferase [Acidimicrobiia bacterium]|nr:4-hydroxybutyrate CoA-transferase [Acidimicrobiia bacterium]